MAGFKAHLAGGIASGAGISLIAFFLRGLSLTQAGAIFVVGCVGGLLPDLDSDTGKPLAFLSQLISILIPSILFSRAAQVGGDSPEFLICYFTISYLFINYVVCSVIKRITIHRGMLHSIPFALVCGGIGYLLFVSSGNHVAIMAGTAVFLGCFVHLMLDELSSFKLKFGLIPIPKKSRGSAFKFKSESLGATLFIYLILTLVVIAAFVSTLAISAF